MNNYPILAPNSTWFAPTNSSVTRKSITEIEIKDSYIPDTSVTIVDSWDASAAKDGSITCYVIGSKLIIAGNGSGKIAANPDSAYAFSMKYVSGVTTDRFVNAQDINGLNLLDVSNAHTLQAMFMNCSSVKTLDVSQWNVSNNTNLASTFSNCTVMENVDVSHWCTDNVNTFNGTFQGCAGLKTLDVSNWNVAKSTSTVLMFFNASSLQTLSLFDMKVTNLLVNSSGAIQTTGMFEGVNKAVKIVNDPVLELDDELTTVRKIFMSWAVMPFSRLITKTGRTSFSYMFCDFAGTLGKLDLSCLDTSSCTDMSFMFYRSSSIGEIDVSNWDVSKVTNFDHFAAHANLRRKGIENWKTTSATNMNALFHNCTEEELDLSGWDVSKVQFFCQMFENSPNLKRIKGLENWDTSSGLGFDGMFERCYKLEEVDLSSFNTAKAKNGVDGSTNGHTTATMKDMFLSCNNLKKVRVGENFSINGDGTNTLATNKFILPTPSADYIEGADGNWYTFTSQDYAPNAIPDRTYNTYYASKDLIRNLSVRINNGTILDIVEAVREKVPNLEPTLLSDLDDIIRNI